MRVSVISKQKLISAAIRILGSSPTRELTLYEIVEQLEKEDPKQFGLKEILPNTVYRSLLNPMEEKGLITCTRGKEPKEKNRYKLTDKGQMRIYDPSIFATDAKEDVNIFFNADTDKEVSSEERIEELKQILQNWIPFTEAETHIINKWAKKDPYYLYRLCALLEFFFYYELMVGCETTGFRDMLNELAQTNNQIRIYMMKHDRP